MHQDEQFDRVGIDAFMVSGDVAVRPWPMEDGTRKELRMIEDLEWTPVSTTVARLDVAKVF
jgi:hypothetical protein